MYYRARWYDPRLGRFIQADTIVPGAGHPQALNRYAYAVGNPVRYVDPSGHCAVNDVECLAEAENIAQTFGATVLDPLDAQWTVETLRWLYQALFQYQVYLGDEATRFYFGNVGFQVNDAALRPGEYGVWEKSVISFSSSAFQETELNGHTIAARTNFVHTALHELTHELVDDLGKMGEYVVPAFEDLGWTEETVVEESGWWIFKSSHLVKVWHSPEDGPTQYARTSTPEEDACETFAVLLSGGSYIQDFPVTRERLGIFARTLRQARALAVQEP